MSPLRTLADVRGQLPQVMENFRKLAMESQEFARRLNNLSHGSPTTLWAEVYQVYPYVRTAQICIEWSYRKVYIQLDDWVSVDLDDNLGEDVILPIEFLEKLYQVVLQLTTKEGTLSHFEKYFNELNRPIHAHNMKLQQEIMHKKGYFADGYSAL